MSILHISGFVTEGRPNSIRVAQHEAATVIEIAKGVIETATSRGTTRVVSFQRVWPLDAYGLEWAVVEVNAVTETTLDGGDTWMPMWHWFGTESSAWPTSLPNAPTRQETTP